MQCDHARILMAARLDGADAPDLRPHLDECPACASEWADLLVVESLLRSQELIEPPPHFATRVMSYVDARSRRTRDWRQNFMQVGAIVTGTLLVLLITAAFMHGWWVALDGASVARQAAGLLRGAGILSSVLVGSYGRGALMWPLYGALAVSLALVWFGALIVPRFAPRAAR